MSRAPWDEVDLSNVWEIGDIRDGSAFIRFILAQTPDGGVWAAQVVLDERLFDALAALSPVPVIPV